MDRKRKSDVYVEQDVEHVEHGDCRRSDVRNSDGRRGPYRMKYNSGGYKNMRICREIVLFVTHDGVCR